VCTARRISPPAFDCTIQMTLAGVFWRALFPLHLWDSAAPTYVLPRPRHSQL